MSTWVRIADEDAHGRALELARGAYQEALLSGGQALSGSTLRGKARYYGAQYAVSRRRLLARLTANGVPWSEERGPHGRRVLVIG